MAEGKHHSLVLCMGLGGLKMWASGSCALVLSVGAAVILLGIGVTYLTKASEKKTQKMYY